MVIALALVALGVVLLLNNFYFITSFNVAALLPLLLVVVGAAVLLRGDLLSGGQGRTFGITRGSVESGVLEVNSGSIDTRLRALPRQGRLIAGQFASDSRPQLAVQDGAAALRFDRAATPFLSFSDWELALARDLPWTFHISTSLGNVEVDLRGLVIQGGLVATGFGDIRLLCPDEVFTPITLRSTLGSIQVLTPAGLHAHVTVHGSRLFHVHSDDARYERLDEVSAERTYRTRAVDGTESVERPSIEIIVYGTFGDLYLA